MSNLPEGAVPVDDNGIAIAESISVDSKAKPVYVAKKPITIELPDGRTIDMATPSVSLSENLAGVLQRITYEDRTMMQMERQRVRCLLYITHINGVAKARIADPIGRAALEQEIGDEFLDDVFVRWTENFLNQTETKVLKKS